MLSSTLTIRIRDGDYRSCTSGWRYGKHVCIRCGSVESGILIRLKMLNKELFRFSGTFSGTYRNRENTRIPILVGLLFDVAGMIDGKRSDAIRSEMVLDVVV